MEVSFKEKVLFVMKDFNYADFLRTFKIAKVRLDHILNGGNSTKIFQKKIERTFKKKTKEQKCIKPFVDNGVINYDEELSECDDLQVSKSRCGSKTRKGSTYGNY